MTLRQRITYAMRDPWDFANPERVATWPADSRPASAMSAGTDETPQEAQGEARQRDGDSRDAQIPPPSPRSAASVQQTAAKNHGE